MTDTTATRPAPLFSEVAAASSGGVPAGHSVVRLPDGSLAVINDSEIRNMTPTPEPDEPEAEAEFYVHLADGSVERVKESDVPAHAGTNALHGFFTRDGYAYVVTGVYPVESKAKG